MKQKIALVDVCDVVVDLHNETIRQLKLEIPERITGWDMFDILPASDCARIKDMFDTPDFWRGLPPTPGAIRGVQALRNQGYRVHFVTSPWITCPGWDDIRREWLGQNLDAHPVHDITFTSQKDLLTAGDLLIDDRPKHIKAWQAANPGKKAWLFDIVFNRWFDWEHRCTWGKDGIVKI